MRTILLAFMVLRRPDSALNYTISALVSLGHIAKYHRLGGLNNRVYFTVLEATESKIKVLTNLTPS